MKKPNSIFFTLILAFFVVQLPGQIHFPVVKGWKLSNTTSYNSETLWEYINGAADYYLNYGFDKLDVAEYQRTEEEYIKLEIYQHNTTLNTFGIYAYERPSEAIFLPLGAEGYIQHSSINFYGKNWYVKIHTHQKDEDAINTIKSLATKVSELMGSETVIPSILTSFPKENKIEHSEKYYPTNFLGMSFFTGALTSDYKSGDKTYSVFIISDESDEQAENMLKKYFEFTKTKEDIVRDKIYTINDFFNGQVNILLTANKLIGILELDDKEKAGNILLQISKSDN